MTTPRFAFQRAMPVLHVAEMGRSLAFWRDRRGFAASTWGEPPTFAIGQRGTLTVALAVVPRAEIVRCSTWAAYLYVPDADAVQGELAAQGLVIEPPETRDYACRDFTVDDPDGNAIGIGHVQSPDALGPGLSSRVGRDAHAAAPAARAVAEVPRSGGCQCGAVRFSSSRLGRASFCHCRMCQKAFAGPGGALVTVHDLAWTRGAPRYFHSSNVVRRGFCGDCGTPLTFETRGAIDVAIAAFDDPAALAPAIELDRAHRIPWVDTLGLLPVPEGDEIASKAAWYAGIVSHQHPDHDTGAWPPAPERGP